MSQEIIRASTSEQIMLIENLAREIWQQHFTPIIGAQQVEYMLQKFQSTKAMLAQISNGCEYYLVSLDNEPVAYAGIIPDPEQKRLMLSKLYVKQSARGNGVGKAMLEFIEQKSMKEGLVTLWLTVNRFNLDTIAWYEHCGFVTVDEVKKDIGGGFFMDDYIMQKSLQESV